MKSTVVLLLISLCVFSIAQASPWIPVLERSLQAKCKVSKNQMPEYYQATLECKSRDRIYDITIFKSSSTALEGDGYYWEGQDRSKGGSCLLQGTTQANGTPSLKVTCRPG